MTKMGGKSAPGQKMVPTLNARRLVSTTKWGLFGGALLTAWVMLLAAINGSFTIMVDDHAINALLMAAIYLAGGAVAGAIVGILFPLSRHIIGSAILGMIAIAPISAAIVFTMVGADGWGVEHTATLVITAVMLGGACGIIYRQIFDDEVRAETGMAMRPKK